MASALKAILEGDGCAVLQASTAEESCSFARGSSGTAGQIKALKATVTIVLHSGSPPENIHHVDGYIHKGEPVRYLLEFLRELINRFWE